LDEARVPLGERGEADALIAELERAGGSQIDLAEGIGAFEVPWIGSWEVKLMSDASDFRFASRNGAISTPLRLVSGRLFVFGPPNAREELRGIDSEGGISTEWIYSPLDEGVQSRDRFLIQRTGVLMKLPEYAYRLDFPQPAALFRYDTPSEAASAGSARDDAAPALSQLPVDALSGAALRMGAGTTLRRITYLSERLWISRNGDGGALLVLQRSSSRALAPPAGRPDLTAPCSDTRGTLCRKQPLF